MTQTHEFSGLWLTDYGLVMFDMHFHHPGTTSLGTLVCPPSPMNILHRIL